MCNKIEAYAKKEAIFSAIESYDECDLSREEIIVKIMKRFDLTEDEANKYYAEVFALA